MEDFTLSRLFGHAPVWGEALGSGPRASEHADLLARLEGMGAEDLRATLRGLLHAGPELSREAAFHLSTRFEGFTKANLRPQVARLNALKKDWYGSRRAGSLLLGLARQGLALDGGRKEGRDSARTLFEAVYGAGVGLMSHVDDSYGYIQDGLRELRSVAAGLAAFPYGDGKERAATLKLFLKVARKPQLSDWPDYAVDLYRLSIPLLKSDKDDRAWEKELEGHLKRSQGKGYARLDRFEEERVAFLQYWQVGFRQGPEAAADYLEEGLGYASFRREALELAEAAGNWERVERLARAGMEADEGTGYVSEWRQSLARALERLPGRPAAELRQTLAETLTGFRGPDPLETFERLKATYSEEEWATARAKVLEEAVGRLARGNPWAALPIYEREKEWDRLLAFAKQDMAYLREYGPSLLRERREGALSALASEIERKAGNARDRKAYRKVVGHLRWLVEQGEEGEAERLAGRLRQAHGRRPSFMAELDASGL